MDELRIGEDIGDRIDRPGRNACLLQRRQEIVTLERRRAGQKRFCERIAMFDTGRIGAETFVRRHCSNAQNRGQFAELAIIAAGDHDMAIGDRKGLIGRDIRMCIAKTARRDA